MLAPLARLLLRADLGFDRHAQHDRLRELDGFLRLSFLRRF